MKKTSSWKTTLIGILFAAVGVFQASQAPSLKVAIQDPKIQLSVLGAILGKLAQDDSNAQ